MTPSYENIPTSFNATVLLSTSTTGLAPQETTKDESESIWDSDRSAIIAGYIAVAGVLAILVSVLVICIIRSRCKDKTCKKCYGSTKWCLCFDDVDQEITAEDFEDELVCKGKLQEPVLSKE